MKNLPAFTLVETLVAIAVLTLAIAVPYYAVDRALVATYVARDQLTAASLAAEGLEYVRAVRDSNYIFNYSNPATPVSWMGGLDGNGGSGRFGTVVNCFTNSCTVDMQYLYAQQCSTSLCTDQPLYLNSYGSGGGEYSQRNAGAGIITRFSRALTLQQISATEVLATVTVTWNTNGVVYHETSSEYFDNWLQ